MKEIIKRITAGILFIAIFFAIIMYDGYISRPYFGDTYKYNTWQYLYAEDDDSLNVITVGSSAIFRFWMPPIAYEEQGFTSLTIGHSAQPFESVPYIIEEVVKTQTPDLIVVEMRSLIKKRQWAIEDDEENQPDVRSWRLDIVASGMKYSSTRFNLIHDLYIDTEGDSELNWHIPVLKHHSLTYSLPLLRRLQRIFPEKHEYKTASTYSNVAVFDDFTTEMALYGDYVLTDDDKLLIDKVVEAGEKYDVEILFISTPFILSEAHNSLRLSLQMYMNENNYPYVDFNDYSDEIGLNFKTDYKDKAHTNVVGAEKFTSYFAQYIADNYDLDNVTLTEKQKKEWADACSAYAKYSAKLKLQWQINCETALAEYEMSASDAASPTDLTE